MPLADDLAERLGRNVKQLRETRGITQQALAKLSGLPRATVSHLESGVANPTLAVLYAMAEAFQVTLEELIATPRAGAQLFPKDSLKTRTQGQGLVRKLLPEAIPGMEIDRFELPPRGRMVGVPHTPGTREYLTCEKGEIVLFAAGEQWQLSVGDVVAFRGDQRHSYMNPGTSPCVGYSVVTFARPDTPPK